MDGDLVRKSQQGRFLLHFACTQFLANLGRWGFVIFGRRKYLSVRTGGPPLRIDSLTGSGSYQLREIHSLLRRP